MIRLPVVFRLHVQMRHERQPRGQMERYWRRFFVRHPSEFAEEMQRFVARELLDEPVELWAVASDFVDLHENVGTCKIMTIPIRRGVGSEDVNSRV